MEHHTIILDDGTGSEFDKRLQGEGILRDGGDLTVVTKNEGTKAHRPIVLFTFTVELPDGSLAKAQTVITMRQFQSTAAVIKGRYGQIE